MATKIEKKIVGFKVRDEEADKPSEAAAQPVATQPAEGTEAPAAMAEVIHMHESVERPEMLLGSTYKIKTPLSEHALYVTINDIILNEGTEHEVRRPFEIFINSKNMDQFQWIVALTRVISAVFRKGGDITFLVEELKAVFDPQGGYFKSGGRFMPSLVAEIGEAIESHMRMIGLLVDPEMEAHQKEILDQKRKEFESQQEKKASASSHAEFPPGAQLCKKCNTTALIQMDGCLTCLNCGDSKCG
ncbi:NrdJb [Biformimicrobium ophioploci]|uniref:ribonucleoside-diphosphate reductase n=1 Tax=Biformimicrobium ophioploci TaxID=3036711 RepID=A0ABQ6LW87_9GAMM|nr:NrdJb [Microbulbifer sp. NKW57]GMG86379.1 hypothetical protein MNKW57_07000 [Microbulbifer sp. NKW57]